MKGNILIFISTCMLFISLGFAFQGQDESKKQQPVESKEPNKADEVLKELEIVKKELAEERRKSDSINAERQVNVDILKKSVIDLQMANKSYRKSLDRLIFIVGKFNPDSVMKFYGEFQEIPPKDTIKKKIEREVVAPEPPKKNIFQKIWSIFKRKNS